MPYPLSLCEAMCQTQSSHRTTTPGSDKKTKKACYSTEVIKAATFTQIQRLGPPAKMKPVLLMLAAFVALGLACNDVAICNNTRNCRCMDSLIPGGLEAQNVPQLVMLTFDDAVTQNNYEPTYRRLFVSSNKNPSGCAIGATFFVSHEYNNYAELHHLWRAGSEMAVHTITHETSTDMWKKADYRRWKNDIVGMRDMIVKQAQIPVEHVKGFRAPFLQTSGDTTFQVLSDAGFTYDSSMTTRLFAGTHLGDDPEDTVTQPIWPFTLDGGFHMDCIIQPCPKSSFPGLWIVPMVSYFRKRPMIDGGRPVLMPCAMADACLPFPETREDTYNYFMENFNRHYLSNRAPFPVFLHESWLKEPERKAGYDQFVNELIGMKDVFIVPVSEVIEYMRNPQPIGQYKEKRCVIRKLREKCPVIGTYCPYSQTELGGPRVMFTCLSEGQDCPDVYPWLRDLP